MHCLLRVSLAVAGLAAAASSSAGAGTFVPIVPPAGSTSTLAFGITDMNIIAGAYVDTSGVQHGFFGPFDGTNYTTFDDPGGITEPRAINDKGFITGYDVGTVTPWERFPDGTLKTVTMNGTALNQLAQGMDKAGVFGGNYDNSSSVSVPYLGKKAKWTSDVTVTLANSGAAARGIDKAGDVVGWFIDPSTGLQHGLLIVGGTDSQIDYPNAIYTVFEGINDRGIASGQYEDTSGVIHGFYYVISTQKFVTVDVSGASLTQVWGINDHDVIALSSSSGSYVYCIHARGCPAAAGGDQPQRGSSRPEQQ